MMLRQAVKQVDGIRMRSVDNLYPLRWLYYRDHGFVAVVITHVSIRNGEAFYAKPVGRSHIPGAWVAETDLVKREGELNYRLDR